MTWRVGMTSLGSLAKVLQRLLGLQRWPAGRKTAQGRRGEIHLGDLAKALKKLNWQDDTEAAAIAAHLGFGLGPGQRPGEQPRPPREIYDRQLYRPQPAAAPAQHPPPVYTPPAPHPKPELPRSTLPSNLTPLDPSPPEAAAKPDWLNQADDYFARKEETALARLSLFPQTRSRAILAGTLATPRAGGDLDVARLVRAICRREIVRALPRLPSLSLDRGCQLLLDFSASTVPWWDDLTGLMDQVQHVVGEQATVVYSFDRDPGKAIRWTPQGRRVPWRPDGRPVLVATDFGIQGRAGRAVPPPGWTTLISRCAQHGSPLVVLVPWPEDRWPRDFGRTGEPPTLVHWNPHTSAAMIGHRLTRRR